MGDLRLAYQATTDPITYQDWSWVERVQFMRDTFHTELEGVDELGWFAQLAVLFGSVGEVLALLEPGMSDRRVVDVRRDGAMRLLWLAAACVEVSERLLDPEGSP
jgi:hypothetical protein